MSTKENSGISIELAKEMNIPFLVFADDLLIFCRARKKAARYIKQILDHLLQYIRTTG